MADQAHDAALVQSWQGGDLAAFEMLYHRHCDPLLRMARRLARDEHLSLEAVQEAFIYLIEKARQPEFRLREGVRLTTLLYPVIRNHIVDQARIRQRFVGDAEAVLQRQVADQPTPEVEAKEVRAVLDRLPAAQREAIELHVLEGFTLAEIAAATATPLGTVKTRLHHGLAKLRDDPATRNFFEKS